MTLPLLNTFAETCKPKSFFGLDPWYKYINDGTHFSGCDVIKFHFFPGKDHGSDIPLVLLVIVDDLLRIAAIVAVAFVIVGAIKLIASQGNPEDTAQAQSTIINALIGLAVCMVAVAFISFVGNRLSP